MRSPATNFLLPAMKNRTLRNYMTTGGIIFFILFWTIILWVYDPKQLVDFIGVKNGYILTFIIAIIGALTSITPVSIYPMIIALALGDLSPLPLALVAGAGLALGDALFFFFGLEFRPFLSKKWKNKLEKLIKWIEDKPRWLSSFLIYLYIGFTPFPNNLLTGSLALAGLTFRKMVIPLILGDMTLPIIIVFLAHQGINLF